jgi:hypothetical protein
MFAMCDQPSSRDAAECRRCTELERDFQLLAAERDDTRDKVLSTAAFLVFGAWLFAVFMSGSHEFSGTSTSFVDGLQFLGVLLGMLFGVAPVVGAFGSCWPRTKRPLDLDEHKGLDEDEELSEFEKREKRVFGSKVNKRFVLAVWTVAMIIPMIISFSYVW